MSNQKKNKNISKKSLVTTTVVEATPTTALTPHGEAVVEVTPTTTTTPHDETVVKPNPTIALTSLEEKVIRMRHGLKEEGDFVLSFGDELPQEARLVLAAMEKSIMSRLYSKIQDLE